MPVQVDVFSWGRSPAAKLMVVLGALSIAARPIYHHLKDSIEPTSPSCSPPWPSPATYKPAAAHCRESSADYASLQQITIQLAGQQLHAEPTIPDDLAEMLTRLGH